MKFLTLLILLFSLPAIAQFKDNMRQDLPFVTVISNAGFERGQTKWTASTPAHLTITTTTPYEGINSGVWNAAANLDTLTTNPAPVPAGWANKSCLASFQYDWQGTLGHIEFKVQDGGAADLITAVVLTPTEAGVWTTASAAFPCPSSGTMAIKLEATADAAAIKLDKFWLGQDYRIGETNQVIVTPWESFTPTGSWTTNTTYTGFKRRVGDSMEIRVEAVLAGAPNSAQFLLDIPDGLTIDTAAISGANRENLGQAFLNDTGTAANRVFAVIKPDSSGDQVVRAIASGNSNVSETVPFPWASGDEIDLNFTVPIVGWENGTTNTVTLETQGWRIDANIGGGGLLNLGTAAGTITAYEAPSRSDLDLVINTSKGSFPVGIACASTEDNAVGSLTCTTEEEQIGVVFNAPYSGFFDACASFSHLIRLDQTEQVHEVFQLALTGNGSQTITQEGGAPVESAIIAGTTAGLHVRDVDSVEVCGTFNLVPGKTTIRLMHVQEIVGTPVWNQITTDRSGTHTGANNEVRFIVRPSTQNFTQAVALIGDEYERGRVMVRQGSTHNGIVVNVTAASGVNTINTTEDVTWLRPFSMLDESGVERWFLELSISARITSDITANSTFTINGVDFSDHDNTAFTALSAAFSRSGGGTRTGEGYIVHSTDTITAENGDSGLGYNRVAVQGTIVLQSKPTWVP